MNIFTRMCAIICVGSIITTVFYSVQYITQRNTMITQAKENALEKTRTTADRINRYTTILENLVNDLAKDLSESGLSGHDLKKRLEKKPLEVAGFGVAYTSEKNALYFVEHEGEQRLIELENEKYKKNSWFTEPLTKGAQFQGPFIEEPTNSSVIQYAAPFYEKGSDQPIGIVFARQSINHLKHILSTLYLGQNGYWFIVSHDGMLLVHPNSDFVHDKLGLNDIAEKYQISIFKEVAEDITQKKAGFKQYRNEMTKSPSWLFYEPMSASNWTLCGVFDLQELTTDIDATRQLLIRIICFALLALCFGALYAISFVGAHAPTLWILSGGTSCGLIIGLVSIWLTVQHYPHYRENLLPMYDKASLNTFLGLLEETPDVSAEEQKDTAAEKTDEESKKEYIIRQHLRNNYQDPSYIQTGIYLNYLRLIEQNQVSIVGYVWQRYIDGIHDNLSRGFIFPQATSDDEIQELYRTKHNGQETIIWHVKATLNQFARHERYPFDVKDIQIQLRHRDFERDVILIPDLDSYPVINPAALPGVSENAFLAGWNMTRSYFGYATVEQQSIFGLYSYGPFGVYKINKRMARPGLHLNIVAQRSLVDTLVADLLPIMVILFLLFLALLMSVQQEYAILGTCASIFFGAVFAEVRFRAKIPFHELVYFEYFYFIVYGALLSTLIVSILYLLKFNITFIQYERNRIAKLLLLPLVLIQAILITVYYLY